MKRPFAVDLTSTEYKALLQLADERGWQHFVGMCAKFREKYRDELETADEEFIKGIRGKIKVIKMMMDLRETLLESQPPKDKDI